MESDSKLQVHGATLTIVTYWHKRRRQFDIFQNPLESLILIRILARYAIRTARDLDLVQVAMSHEFDTPLISVE